MSFAINKPQPSTSTSTATSVQWSQPCRQFNFHEILLATENFKESLVIGEGSYGKVYKGNVMNGSSVVAIKRLNSNSSPEEFWAEVHMLSNLRHCHLVSLIGCCIHGNEMILVYEYMPQGTLKDHLHKHSHPLSWIQLLKICKGAARGLDYLHSGTGTEHGVIHGDVKSSNILLHETLAAKISDFGLSRIGPKNNSSIYLDADGRGTFGYLDPNYNSGWQTTKSDVYAFGVVLLEVLCRKRAVDKSLGKWGLAGWAQEHIKDGKLKQIVDSGIWGQISTKCLKNFVGIAERCLHRDPKQRPRMSEVVVGLESVLNLQEKTNNSLQSSGKTIFGRMVDKLPFPSRGDHSAHGDPKLSSDNTGRDRGNASNMLSDTREVSNLRLRVFEFGELEKATENFRHDHVLGLVAFGRVFVGWVTFRSSRKDVKIRVAIKRRSVSRSHAGSRGHAQWMAEVRLLERLAHSNIIRLLGYCNHEQEYLLVYEYMSNLSLDRLLYRNAQSSSKQVKPLSWRIRLAILIGVAHGLTYLHSSSVQIIHHDIKSSSILLDQDFNAKLGGFGMATTSHEITSANVVRTITIGNRLIIAPEYALTGNRLSVKCDIYSFGVVLFETLTGLTGTEITERCRKYHLVECASLVLEQEGNLKLIIDPYLGRNYPQEGAFKLLTLASKCLANRPEDRPSSEEVLRSLEHINVAN